MESKVYDIIFDGGDKTEDILQQLLTSDYCEGNTLNIDKFLDSDRTIDLERLELAIILLIGHLEKSIKIGMPIYINIGNMEEYVEARRLKDMDRIIEESSFILGFSQSIASENEIDREVTVRFKGKE